jgi:hypothetical protein
MISTDCTIIYLDIWLSSTTYCQSEIPVLELTDTYDKRPLPHAQSATAFHFFT